MKQIMDSCEKVVRQKLSNSVYGNFIFFWIIFHWNFLYSMFALDDDKILEKTGLLKNEYLISKFFDFGDWYLYFSWVMPIALTYLAIWHFQKWIFVPAFKKDEQIKTEKEMIRIGEEKKRQQGEKELADLETKKLQAVEKKIVLKRSIEKENPEIEWEKEYQDFKKNDAIYPNYPLVIKSIYGNRGFTYDLPESFSNSVLVYMHSHGLISMHEDEQGNQRISFTDKGTFFARKYSEDA